MELLDIENINFDNIVKKDSVIIEFLSFKNLDIIHEIDQRLIEIIPDTVGYHDMHEVAIDDSHGSFFSYGKNAEVLFKSMLPVLKEYDFLDTATVYLNFDNEDKVRELEFKLKDITAD